ncbi:radical SAM protein [Sphingomonas sp. R647]|uniref:radical SAM protein n=1 Tax=Sphingomonas sp. R647 TaxID=2875233 RepID=UPI001CD7A109|nr:radical SAM protein [Sphingomonas sp. R647]MCA1196511.1 radical SAM protein [Sphingomonas sp. R647]
MIVLWRTTTRCNYACGFCAYDRRLDIARDEVGANEAFRFGELLADRSRARATPVMLSWLGGEPLLWRPIWALSAALAGQGLAISATTNGSTLHRPAVRADIVTHFAELTVSIDGRAPVHDRLRGRAGAWDKVRDGLRALAAERGNTPLKLRANIVLMRDTIAHFADLCTALAEWGVDEITFNQLGGRDRPAFFPAQRLRAEDITALATLVPALRQRLAARGVTLCGDARYLDRLRASASGEALAVDDCRPGRNFLFIDEHGVAAPCSFSGAAYGVPLAALRTVADLDALPARFAAARAAQRLATCDDCPSTQTFAKFAA